MDLNERTINKTNLYSGKIIKLDLHEVELNNKKVAYREVITHSGGVGVIPITENNEIYLIKQFRKPYDCEVIEIPAGKLEKGEEPLTCGIRELEEETGLSAQKFTCLTEMYPSPGYTNEKIYLFKAEGLTQGDTKRDEDEFMSVKKYSKDEALNMVYKGIIKDAKTIIAILMAFSKQ